MATHNTGPFDSDCAQDLLELHAELTAQERLANLRVVFAGGIRHPGGPFEPVEPSVSGSVERVDVLGGLIHEYRRAA